MERINNYALVYLKYDFLITLAIILLPFVFFVYNLAPEKSSVWSTPFFHIDSGLNENVNYFLWNISTKVLTLSIISIWFLTCKHWWRWVILVPFVFEIYKLLGIFNFSYSILENYNFIKSLPVSLFLIALLFRISKGLNYYSNSNNFNSQLNNEINELMQKLSLFKKNDYKELKIKLKELKKKKNTMNKNEYLIELISIRDNLNIN